MKLPVVLTTTLVVIWLLLAGELSVGQLLLGTALAVMLMLVASQMRPVRPRLSSLYLIAPLLGRVVLDVVASNIAVARIILGLAPRGEVRSGFLEVPLELSDPHGLAILSAIITSTPGTAWGGVSPDGKTLTLHILDLRDEAEWIRIIKDRYERPLRRIFE